MFQLIEDVTALWWTVRRKPLEAFLAPSAVLDDALLCGDGSLVSMFRVEGVRSMMGAEELRRFVDVAARELNGLLLDRGHALQVVFERASDQGSAVVEAVSARQVKICEGLGLELGDLVGERERRLGPLLAEEALIVAAWTRPAALTRQQGRRDRAEVRKRLKGWLPGDGDSQCPLAIYESLGPRHSAMMDTLGAVFRESGVAAERLDGAGAARVLRVFVNGAESTAPDWRPAGVENEARPRGTEPAENGFFPPPLAPQLLVRDPERQGSGLEIGGRVYGTLNMTLGPREPRPFSELIARLAEAGLPFRLSMLIEGGGLAHAGTAVARVAASFLAFSSFDSRGVRDSLGELTALRAESRAVVRFRMGLLTWVSREEQESILVRNVSRLQQLADGWGEMAFTPLVGDVLEAFAATVPGLCCAGTGEAAVAPLTEVLRLMPVGRPAPLAREGINHLFRSPDGRVLPLSYERAADYGFELIYGLPDRGKSVLMNSLGLGFCLQGRSSQLPQVAVIDVGPSSSGLISLIREALPWERRGEAVWWRLEMSAAWAVNPCDTQLGCREPLPAEREFLSNLLGLILTPAEAVGVPDGLREAIGPTIAAAYAMRSDRVSGGQPNPYTVGRDAEVDEALARHGCRVQERTVWWEIVDLLFEAGAHEAAGRAQRYAVPVLGDLVAAVRDDAVQALIGEASYGTGGESVTQAFQRMLTGAGTSWPVMFAPTAFSLSGARVAGIDLAAVAPQGSWEADRQTAAMYMLARHALTRDWWLGEESLEGIEEPYRHWHRDRLKEIRETPKRLAFDEFHRTGGAPAVRAQVERDARECRKQRVRLVLASQRLDDFGKALVDLANWYWVLGAGGKREEIETLSEVFDLNETLREVISYELTGPGRNGAPALLIAPDERGRYEQVVVNTPGPVELWALSTSPADVALRNRLYDRVPPAQARALLARAFESGSVRRRLEDEIAKLEARGVRGGAAEAEVLDRLAAELAGAAAGAAIAA